MKVVVNAEQSPRVDRPSQSLSFAPSYSLPLRGSIRPSMHMIRRIVIWMWRAWPVLVMLLLASAHFQALATFPNQSVLVNKITGTLMQIVGGLIVLYSIDSNLGLFRNQSLVTSVIAWFRECPLYVRSVTVSASVSGSFGISGSASASVGRAATTVEERLAEVERRLEDLRSEVVTKNREIYSHITDVKIELSNSIASNQATLNKLSEKLEKVIVGGFKQQSFGVMLLIYGAVTSVFT